MRVGFIGLGDIGMPMALTLIDQQFDVVGVDVREDRCDALRQAGASIADGLADLADCDVVCVAVPDDATVTDIVVDRDLIGRLGSGTVLIHSTVLPTTAERLADACSGTAVDVIDAPVSGGAARARTGDLTIMVGGTAAAPAAKVIDALGTPVACGRVGAGAAVKLANQLAMLASLKALHEGLRLTGAYDVDENLVLDTLHSSTGDSWVARNWGFFDDLAAEYDRNGVEVQFRPWSKDIWDVVATARDLGFPAPLAAILSQILPDVVEQHAKESRARR